LAITRRRAVLGLIGGFVLAMLLLAIVDREASYMTLYVVGAILLLLGSAAGIGGGGMAGQFLSRDENPAGAHRETMDNRAAGLAMNLVILLAGALLIGLGVVINLI
jgi:hypothetical protein